MSIRHLFLLSGLVGLGAGPWALAADTAHPAAATSAAVNASASLTLNLQQVLQAARQSPDVLAAQRALNAARADVRSADRAPAPSLSAGISSIDLQNGTGGGSFWTQKRIDKSLGLDWTWERGNKRALRTEAAQRSANAAQADSQDALLVQQIGAQAAFYDLLAAQQRLQAVQAIAQESRAVVLLEAPHRMAALAQALAVLGERRVTVGRELTKQFEQIETLAAAALPTWLAEKPEHQRGEFVLVVHDQPVAPSRGEGERILKCLLAELPVKTAVKLAAEISGEARNALYERALALKNAD